MAFFSWVFGCCASDDSNEQAVIVDAAEAVSTQEAAAEEAGDASGNFSCGERLLEMEYPMYVVPMAVFMDFSRFVMHQALLEDDLLVTYSDELMDRALIVSHQWLGYTHPDPNGDQCRVCREFFAKGMEGIPSLEMYPCMRLAGLSIPAIPGTWWKEKLPGMHIWLDYCSMPQPSHDDDDEIAARKKNNSDGRVSGDSALVEQLMKAVRSIPAYVERVALVMVCAPAAVHQDTGEVCNYATWAARGWCRAEMACAFLVSNTPTVFLIQGSGALDFILPPELHCDNTPVGEGQFTCCQMHHTLDGKHIPCDKARVSMVINRLLDAKLARLRTQGDMGPFRALTSVRSLVTRGLPASPASAAETYLPAPVTRGGLPANMGLQRMRESLAWESSEGESLAMLLTHAILMQDAIAVKSLLEQGVDPNVPTLSGSCTTAARVGAFAKTDGENKTVTSIMVAAARSSPEIFNLLVDAKADISAKDGAGCDATFYAACSGKDTMLRAWSERFPSHPLPVKCNTEFGPLDWMSCPHSLGGADPSTIGALVELRADPDHVDALGLTLLIRLCLNPCTSDEALRVCLAARVDPNLETRKTEVMLSKISSSAVALQWWQSLQGCTPLHIAVRHGNSHAVKALLEAEADPERRSDQGFTPLELAEQYVPQLRTHFTEVFELHGFQEEASPGEC